MNITDLTFQEETKEGITVIDFWAEWCGPCRSIAPIIDELSEKYKEQGIKIMKANVDECSELSSKFGIRSIPTLVTLKNGIEVARHVGAGPIAQKVEEMISKAHSV